jgi:hypothetical protein
LYYMVLNGSRELGRIHKSLMRMFKDLNRMFKIMETSVALNKFNFTQIRTEDKRHTSKILQVPKTRHQEALLRYWEQVFITFPRTLDTMAGCSHRQKQALLAKS